MTMPQNEDLEKNLRNWLSSEGYPLEYYASHTFSAAGFWTSQGRYTRDNDGTKRREIDVIAKIDYQLDKRLIRIENIVECKWSGDKPLVVFTSPDGQMRPSTCMCHAVSSETADALLWLSRDNEDLAQLQLFDAPSTPGFGGRQAFSKNDALYKAMMSSVNACVRSTEHADMYGSKGTIKEFSVISFPILVMDGPLYKAGYDSGIDEMWVKKADHVRCHWRGSPDRHLTSTIDVVTRAALPDFARKRLADCRVLGQALIATMSEMLSAFGRRDGSLVLKAREPTGRSGAPDLIVELHDLIRAAQKSGNQVP